MRVVIWLSIPVMIFAIALLYAMIMNWTEGVPLCDTWLRGALPLCR
jgi:hypothetical protein